MDTDATFLLTQVQCQIFSTTYNPDGIRMGNKILRQRLRGPSLVKYYPPRGPDLNLMAKDFKKYGLEVIDEEEEDRQEHLAGQVSLDGATAFSLLSVGGWLTDL